eukprot:RCo010932
MTLPQKTQIAAYPIPLLTKQLGEYMPVIDPVGQFSGCYSLLVPWEAIEETEGFHRFLRHQHPHPSLCMLYQSGRCRLQRQCNQIHAEPAVVQRMRESSQSLRQVTCCQFHNRGSTGSDPAPQSLKPALTMVTFSGGRIPIPFDRTEVTAYLERIMSQPGTPGPVFPMSYVCRLHQKRRCGYAQQCGHVHICREFWGRLFQEHPWLQTEPDPSVKAAEKPEKPRSRKAGKKSGKTAKRSPQEIAAAGLSPCSNAMTSEALSSSLELSQAGARLLEATAELERSQSSLEGSRSRVKLGRKGAQKLGPLPDPESLSRGPSPMRGPSPAPAKALVEDRELPSCPMDASLGDLNGSGAEFGSFRGICPFDAPQSGSTEEQPSPSYGSALEDVRALAKTIAEILAQQPGCSFLPAEMLSE